MCEREAFSDRLENGRFMVVVVVVVVIADDLGNLRRGNVKAGWK